MNEGRRKERGQQKKNKNKQEKGKEKEAMNERCRENKFSNTVERRETGNAKTRSERQNSIFKMFYCHIYKLHAVAHLKYNLIYIKKKTCSRKQDTMCCMIKLNKMYIQQPIIFIQVYEYINKYALRKERYNSMNMCQGVNSEA